MPHPLFPWLKKVEEFLHEEDGAIIIFYAVLLPIILAFAAFAVDFGFSYGRKGGMQAAADAAAMAGALQFVSNNPSGLSAASNTLEAIKTGAVNEAYASLNYSGYSNGLTDSFRTVTVNSPVIDDISNPYTVTVSFHETRNLSLVAAVTRLLGGNYSSTQIGVRASAQAFWKGNNCLLALSKTGVGFAVNGSVTVGSNNVPKCGIAVDSSDPCAMDTRGTSVNIDVPIYTVGGICMTGSPTQPPTSHGPYIPDPYDVSGSKAYISNYYDSVTSLAPAGTPSGQGAQRGYTLPKAPDNTYYATDPMTNVGPQGVLTLTSGTYVFKNGFNVSSQQTVQVASGGTATIIVGGPTTSIGAGGTLNIPAQTSGPLQGIGFACLTCATVNFSGGSSFSGTIYAPNANVAWQGNSGTPASACLQIVANTISLGGNVKLNDSCASSKSGNYYARLTE